MNEPGGNTPSGPFPTGAICAGPERQRAELQKDDPMRMKMNTSLCGPTVNVAPGGVHVCSADEAIRHYRAGHGTPTEDCAEEFKAALAEQEAVEATELAALNAGEVGDEGGGDQTQQPANESSAPGPVPPLVILAQQPGQIASVLASAAPAVATTPAAKTVKPAKAKA